MKLTYDPRYNVAYIALHDSQQPVETLQISEELNIDIAPDGTVYGIELLNANEQLGTGRHGKLLVVNEARGEEAEIAFTTQ